MSFSKEVIILMLGETGAGKSTLLNYIGNFFLSGSLTARTKYDNVKIIIPNSLFPSVTDKIASHSENNILDKTKSQTSKPTSYTFSKDGMVVKIIDTPGFGDTDRKKDESNLQNIFAEASAQKFISAIVLVINGSVARETTSLKFVLESMKGAVPNSLLTNIIIVLTNCDESTVNFELKLLNGISTKNVFHMQNNAFSNDLRLTGSEKLWKKLSNEWLDSMETLKQLIELCKNMTEGSAADFFKMKFERENLQHVANDVISDTINLFQAIEAINDTEIRMKEAELNIESNKDFKKMQTIKVQKKTKMNYYSTICTEHMLTKICHEKCGLELCEATSETHFQSCNASAGNGFCRVCNCSMSIHYHTFEIIKEVDEDQEVIINEMKAKYDQAVVDASNAQGLIDSNSALKKRLQDEIDNKKKELNKACANLKSLCSNFNFYQELKGIMEKLEKESKISNNFDKKKEFDSMANAIKEMIKN